MRSRAVHLIASSQLIDEMLEVGRWTGAVRAKHLPKALADGIADRSAGLVIEPFYLVRA
jgi:hypothetical protein